MNRAQNGCRRILVTGLTAFFLILRGLTADPHMHVRIFLLDEVSSELVENPIVVLGIEASREYPFTLTQENQTVLAGILHPGLNRFPLPNVEMWGKSRTWPYRLQFLHDQQSNEIDLSISVSIAEENGSASSQKPTPKITAQLSLFVDDYLLFEKTRIVAIGYPQLKLKTTVSPIPEEAKSRITRTMENSINLFSLAAAAIQKNKEKKKDELLKQLKHQSQQKTELEWKILEKGLDGLDKIKDTRILLTILPKN